MESQGKRSINHHRPCKKPIIDSPVHVHQGWLKTLFLNMRGTAPKYITKKTLTTTDLTGHHSQLLLHKEDVKRIIPELTEEERTAVEGEEGLMVKVLDTLGREYDMKFKYWPDNKGYVFNGPGWKKFCEDNKLEKDDGVPLWAFRVKEGGREEEEEEKKMGKLCMAMPIETEVEKKARMGREIDGVREEEEEGEPPMVGLDESGHHL